jgi:hypothetical protein
VFQINEEVEKLKALKLELAEESSNGNGNGNEAPASGKVILKTAKGTRDYQPEQVSLLFLTFNSQFFL